MVFFWGVWTCWGLTWSEGCTTVPSLLLFRMAQLAQTRAVVTDGFSTYQPCLKCFNIYNN